MLSSSSVLKDRENISRSDLVLSYCSSATQTVNLKALALQIAPTPHAFAALVSLSLHRVPPRGTQGQYAPWFAHLPKVFAELWVGTKLCSGDRQRLK